jgi:hypothetical protein
MRLDNTRPVLKQSSSTQPNHDFCRQSIHSCHTTQARLEAALLNFSEDATVSMPNLDYQAVRGGWLVAFVLVASAMSDSALEVW